MNITSPRFEMILARIFIVLVLAGFWLPGSNTVVIAGTAGVQVSENRILRSQANPAKENQTKKSNSNNPADSRSAIGDKKTKEASLSIAGRAVMTFRSMVSQVLWVVVPVAAFALAFHFLESFVLQRLVERFGWNAALWTGWIGTPIHESSHAILCLVFQHRIEKMALFQPDLVERRLGFVRHTYTKGKLWQEVGNFFIGLAPLAGGTLTLLLLSWLLYPKLVEPFFPKNEAAVVGSLEVSSGNPSAAEKSIDDSKKMTADPWGGFTDLSVGLAESFGTMFTFSNLVSWRFWLFLYLVMCVSVHMAPSASDYHGAKQGGLILFGIWLSAHLVHGLLGLSMASWGWFFWPYWLMTVGTLVLATGLGLMVVSVVFVVTEAWDLAVGRRS